MPWSPVDDLRHLLELAAPAACAGCGEAGERWCRRCAAALDGPARAWSPTPAPPGMPPCWSGPAYADVVRTAVVAWKDGGRHDLTPALGEVLGRSVAAAVRGTPVLADHLRGGGDLVLVPAPSARSSVRARGWEPVRAAALAAVAGVPGAVVLPALRLGRPVADQAGLDSRQRSANLAGAMRVRPRDLAVVQGIPVVVVDDVVTTGATLAEAFRALREGGCGPVVAATVAATARRDARPAPALPSP